MKKALSAVLVLLLITLQLNIFASAASEKEAAPVNPASVKRDQYEKSLGALGYTPVKLKPETKQELVRVDGDIKLTVFSSESDFVCGEYLSHYYGLPADADQKYLQLVNTLKTMAEYNDYITLSFVDPFSTYAKSVFSTYTAYAPKYGDIMISCYSNFDGNPKTRHEAVRVCDLFTYPEGSDGLDRSKMEDLQVETKLIERINYLRTNREINVAYISELCRTQEISALQSYLYGRSYNIKSVSFLDEKLSGYDMILIVAPMRDATLEEIVTLEEFMSNGGKGGKALAYFSPEEFISLPNLYGFLEKWGIIMEGGQRISAKDGYYIDQNQLLMKSCDTSYTTDSDRFLRENNAFYIMENCTPMAKAKKKHNKITVTELFVPEATELSKASINPKDKSGPQIAQTYPSNDTALMLLSEKETAERPSYVLSCCSSDFITGFFALETDIKAVADGRRCANLPAVFEIIEKLNAHHREEESGLKLYAIGKNEQGIELTSGLDRTVIMTVAFGGVAVAIVAFAVILVLTLRREEKLNRRKSRETE